LLCLVEDCSPDIDLQELIRLLLDIHPGLETAHKVTAIKVMYKACMKFDIKLDAQRVAQQMV